MYTKGPWRVKKNCFDYGGAHGIYSGSVLISKVCAGIGDPAKIEDARLIAAAPELLEALESILPELQRSYEESNLDWCFVDMVKQAINRAKGE